MIFCNEIFGFFVKQSNKINRNEDLWVLQKFKINLGLIKFLIEIEQ